MQPGRLNSERASGLRRVTQRSRDSPGASAITRLLAACNCSKALGTGS